MSEIKVDIIIPIYNAAEDLKICLESIYKYTDLSKNRLILINDNSPDPQIKEILSEQTKENVIVINNEKNQGFSANINLGMRQSEYNDVLLLNSDTIVTKNWIEKIVRCAYSSQEIGTVTPLSNNATLCSVPVFCEENKLPEGYDADKMGDLVEKCSMRKYPRISVAHGFCMFIKREVINKVGYFDAETFGRGYGEENDYCNRAEQLGYIHVQCDDTFIMHTGTKSFVSAEKEEYIRKHDAILRKRYPKQMHANDVYVRDNPNGYIQENIRVFLDVFNGKKNILYVVHSDFRDNASDNIGGTQLHVHHLKDALVDSHNVFVAARDGNYLNLTLYTSDSEHFWKFYIGEPNNYFRFYDRELKKVWNTIFDSFAIDLVHVHHVYSLSFDIFDVAKQHNTSVIMTCHDYYCVSPSIGLLDSQYRIIEKNTITENEWRNTLKYWVDIYTGIDYISVWQKTWEKYLLQCAKIVVPDISVKRCIVEYYPSINELIEVIPHGYDFDEPVVNTHFNKGIASKIEKIKYTALGCVVNGWVLVDDKDDSIEQIYVSVDGKNSDNYIPTSISIRRDVVGKTGAYGIQFVALIPRSLLNYALKFNLIIYTQKSTYMKKDVFKLNKKLNDKETLNVAFVGGINKQKGGDIIESLLKKKIKNINYYVFGTIGSEALADVEYSNVYKFGTYSPKDLPRLMKLYDIDVVCILSIGPETFSYTLSEVLICGIPVIVTDVGALGERTKDASYAWKVSVDNACNEVAEILQNLVRDRSALENKQNKVSEARIESISNMIDKYKELYSGYYKNSREDININENAEILYMNYVYRTSSIGEENNSEMRIIMANRDWAIMNSYTYKIAKKLCDINFPFKNKLYLLVKKKFG